MNKNKILQLILNNSKNVRFSDAVSLAKAFGFALDRINGSHHIFKHPDKPALLNLQNVKGKAKPYQLKQLIQLIERYNLKME
ncbi:YcfA-like protein [Candidatus Magnetomorum sp. HK-1]|nr:YcfA-like protein [Candidatus Magnetomorum sp. HK-1]